MNEGLGLSREGLCAVCVFTLARVARKCAVEQQEDCPRSQRLGGAVCASWCLCGELCAATFLAVKTDDDGERADEKTHAGETGSLVICPNKLAIMEVICKLFCVYYEMTKSFRWINM